MNCPSCGAQNRPEGKFCSECGAPLTRACSSCGAALRPGAKFCDECGSVVVAPDTRPPAASTRTATAPTAERRLVSVLFADLVGFTTLSESRDSEDVRELLSRYFETSRQLIARYGGTIEKFIADNPDRRFQSEYSHRWGNADQFYIAANGCRVHVDDQVSDDWVQWKRPVAEAVAS